MQAVKANISSSALEGHWTLFDRKVPRRAIFPIGIALLAIVGILSPLFDLHQVHGLPSTKLYTQHLFFDSIADAGGYWASTFCKHWYHRIPVAIGFALLSTLTLVTLVG